DAAADLLYVGGHAFVALAADAHRPRDRGALADGLLPGRADLGQVVGEVEAGARAVGTVDHGDLRVRQRDAAVEGDDGRIVPVGDPAEEDVGQGRAVELHRPGTHAFEVDDRDHAADHRRELGEAGLLQFLRRQRLVAGAEVDGAGLDLGDPAAGADRLVIDLLAG